MSTASESKVKRVQSMLDEIDRMRLSGWRWSEMYDWVRGQLVDPALRPDAIRQLVSRARRRRNRICINSEKEPS